MIGDPETLLRRLLDGGIAAVSPANVVSRFLPAPPAGRTVVVGGGKGAAAMARAVEDHWPEALSGLVVTPYGHTVPCRHIEIVEAAHPAPDDNGVAVARRMLRVVRALSAEDLVLCLLSGGASSLLSLPAAGVGLEAKRAVTCSLLLSGATIAEINCVRKHLSAIKGGRLGAACAPARLVTLAISDVPGDDLSTIGSGPTVADPTTLADAISVLAGHGIEPPPAVAAALAEESNETPKPGDTGLAAGETFLIATPQTALEAAAKVARRSGVTPVILGDRIEGEARDVAKTHAALARRIATSAQPVAAPAVVLSGGEVTVTVRGDGRGGPNLEFLLALAIALDGQPGVHALAVDTDGRDGTADAAGATVGPAVLSRAGDLHMDPRSHLARNDSYGFFASLGSLVVTGPTLTNVGDFRAIFVAADR